MIFENLFWPWYLNNVDQIDPRINCTFEEYAGVHAEEHTTESQERFDNEIFIYSNKYF